MSEAKLNELDKDEWMLVCKQIKPDLRVEEYDKLWDEFVQEKNKRSKQ